MSDSLNPKNPFPKVAEARESLKADSLAMVELYKKAVMGAMAAEEYEVAIKGMQWLIEHSPSHDGVSILDTGIDVPKQEKGSKGPQIQIGIKLGHQGNIGGAGNPGSNRALPLNQPEVLSPEIQVIDITPEHD